MPDLQALTAAWLRENGYDGLCNTDRECSCGLDDLMSCMEPGFGCEAAYKVPVPEERQGEGFDEWYAPTKEGDDG